jgi:uncharacterized membrane protein YbjE (DUF340 family)
MTLLHAYFWTVIGVLISFALPPLLRAAGTDKNLNPTASISAVLPVLKRLLTNRYFVTTILSLIVALIVVALLGGQMKTWNMALINGLGWQSILARVMTPGT